MPYPTRQTLQPLRHEGVLVEIGHWGGTYPHEQHAVRSLIAEHGPALGVDGPFAEFEPFEVDVLDPVRTAVEKLTLDPVDVWARVLTDLGEHDRVVTVPAHLKMVLRALLDNALRFSPDYQPVTIRGVREPDRAIIEIRDYGPGMDDQLLAVAFDRFTQGDGSSRRAHGGLGLGLFTARQLTERLGGTVTTTPADPGLTVTVTLPQQRTTDHPGAHGEEAVTGAARLPEAERNTRPPVAGD